jgi:hypothetical protein
VELEDEAILSSLLELEQEVEDRTLADHRGRACR